MSLGISYSSSENDDEKNKDEHVGNLENQVNAEKNIKKDQLRWVPYVCVPALVAMGPGFTLYQLIQRYYDSNYFSNRENFSLFEMSLTATTGLVIIAIGLVSAGYGSKNSKNN